MEAFLGTVVFWQRWILGVVLAALEIAAPGFIFLWLGIAAGVTGLVLLVFPATSVEIQMLVFAVFSVASVALSRWYLRSRPIESEDPTLNRRAEQYIGRNFTLDQAIRDGRGKVRVGDGFWRVKGADLPAGVQVRVTGVDGATLVVEKVE